MDADGKRLHPASKANGITDIWTKPEKGQLGFSQEFGNDPRFLPALYKIGLSLVAMHFGPEVAAEPTYDHIRSFVFSRNGAPALTAGMSTQIVDVPVSGASNPFTKDNLTYPLFEIMILGFTFLLDLAPDQPGLREIRAAALVMAEPIQFFPSRLAA